VVTTCLSRMFVLVLVFALAIVDIFGGC
jgi:hypothetical protein